MGVLDSLDPEQRRAAEHLPGPLAIVAGAGSGKTTTVARRLAHGVRTGVYEADRCLSLSFTTKAAGEMGQRLADLGVAGVASRTFHSAALRQLNYFWADHVGGAFPRIISDRNDFARRALDEAGLPSDLGSSLLADLDLLGATGTVPEHPQGLTPVEFQAARNAYEGLKRAENCIDFADVLLILIGLLETRAIVRDTVRRQYRWFTVDEFQDTSPIQMRLLRLWLGERRDLCVVGDPAQAIYGFAGADASFLRRFHIEFEEAAVVQLANSYRCARSIVATANSVARDIPDALQLRSMGGAGTRQLLRFPDTDGQARGIAHEVAALVANGHPANEIAVLLRTNQQAEPFLAALNELGVDFAPRSSERFFERTEVKEARTRLRGMARADGGQDAYAAVEDVMTAMNLAVPGTDPARRESLLAIRNRARGPVTDLVAELDALDRGGQVPRPGGVVVGTIHASKGLEWDTVFVPNLIEGMLPHPDASPGAELRLFYVAVTRARNRLVLTHQGRHHGRTVKPSRFLELLGQLEPLAAPTQTRPTAGQTVQDVEVSLAPARCQRCGKRLVTGAEVTLGHCRPCDPGTDPVVDDLLAWRAALATELGVPDYAILTQTTLIAVARARPGTQEALAGVPGLPATKRVQFGESLLEAVRGAAAP